MQLPRTGSSDSLLMQLFFYAYWVVCVAVLAVSCVIIPLTAFRSKRRKGTIAFFHPAAHQGGGGERVLWSAVQVLAARFPDKQLCVYCEEGHAEQELKDVVQQQFGIKVDAPLQVVPLGSTGYLAPERWPRLTLAGQALGSLFVAWEALNQLVPEVWVDTSGWAFAYPLIWLRGSHIVAYVHYPTISSNMLGRVWRREATYNNAVSITRALFLSQLKLVYYCVLVFLYGFVGMFASRVMVNSTWTQGHIERLWWGSWLRKPRVVYPPVDVGALEQIALRRSLKLVHLCSVGQFRPEKNHRLQLLALQRAKELIDQRELESTSSRLKLSIVGGCRDAADRARLEDLRALATELQIEDSVDFLPNASYEMMQRVLSIAVGGLHTMLDEHFGICIVEYMASGCVPIAHNSGGPAADIVRPAYLPGMRPTASQPVGFLAHTVDEYATCIADLVGMPEERRMDMARRARRRAHMFAGHLFERDVAEGFDFLNS